MTTAHLDRVGIESASFEVFEIPYLISYPPGSPGGNAIFGGTKQLTSDNIVASTSDNGLFRTSLFTLVEPGYQLCPSYRREQGLRPRAHLAGVKETAFVI